MKSGQEIKSGRPNYFHLNNNSIWDRPLLPTKIEFIIIAIYIQKIAKRYNTFILQHIREKNGRL